ncbi:MAG TPA: DUF6600 domain-containing protein [Candidatus Angelobacter sp.]|nr:DUF6600 domain-containing protein [Candidatus Angelobacter sp.]
MRKQLLKLASFLCVALAVAFLAPQRAAADDDDPPSRVARLGFTHGNVSFNPSGTDDWVAAIVNRPMTTGDKLWSDDGARAELHLGSAVIRLSGTTGFSFLNLTDQIAQLRLTEGTLNIRVRRLGDDETFEVDTPNLAFNILRPGRYRINVNEAGDTTIVSVRDGQGEVTGGGSAYTIHPRETGTFAGSDTLDADVEPFDGGDQDDFDNWCSDRDRREDHSVSSRYVSDDVIGYEDLDEAGGWRPVPEYGTVWFPHTTIVGWAPYRYGHWAWIAPWGWTWVDDAPWGFAPFHYGRWVVVGGVWGWVPAPPRPVVYGAVYVRPVYAPALVAFVGGPHWGVGVAVGGGGGVGVAWFPLGPRDVYCPSYHVSERYVTNVNVSNTVIVNRTQVTNVYNNVYVNKTVNVTNVTYQNQAVSGAVTATSHQSFTSAQPVGRNMVKVDAREVATAQVAPIAPSVAPPKQAVLGAGAATNFHPPAALATRAVVAKTAPPPAPVSFVKQQQMIQANGGRPVAISEMHQQAQVQAQTAQAARPNIKIAPPASPAVPMNKPANAQLNSNRPGAANNPGAVNNVNQANRPANVPSNPGNPGNTANTKPLNDRPPASRSVNTPNVNPQTEQKQQQQLQDLRAKQDQERQKVEQQQIQERQKAQQAADAQRQAQLDQKHQQQLQQMEQKHNQEEQRLQQKQQQERQKEAKPPKQDKPKDKPPKEEKPHKG